MSMPGFWEIVVLAVLALIIFGPDRLPNILRSTGKTVGTLRREARTAMNELKATGDLDELREASRELRAETRALNREGRELAREAGRITRDGPAAGHSARDRRATSREPVGADAAAADEPTPFDPDVP